MQFIFQSYHILLATLIGWVNERRQQIIELQNDQIEALLKNLGKKRVLLTDDQRRVLVVKGRADPATQFLFAKQLVLCQSRSSG